MADIQGTNDAGFGRVRQALASCMFDYGQLGCGLSVFVQGRNVVNLWSGYSNTARTEPWKRDTLVTIWSSSKGVLATAIAIAAQRGKLRYEDLISKYWPEFAENGKDKITLEHVLTHTSGLNGFNSEIGEGTLYDWNKYISLLEQMKPNWQPGRRSVYHGITIGFLAGEPLRRVTGKTVGQFIHEEISKPLNVDFHIGVPLAEDHRCAQMHSDPEVDGWINLVQASAYPQGTQFPRPDRYEPNMRGFRAAEIPGINGHSTAEALAAIYGDLVSGQSRLLDRASLVEATRLRYRGVDEGFGIPIAWGAGFRLENPGEFGTRSSSQSFGHAGWGGSVGFADPEAQIGFAFLTNHMMEFGGPDPRRERLVSAVYDCLK